MESVMRRIRGLAILVFLATPALHADDNVDRFLADLAQRAATAAVDPQALSAVIKADADALRVDAIHHEFYQLLEKQGVTVVDLLPLYREHRRDPEGPPFCKTDTHWSGRGIVLAAEAIADRVRDRPWLKAIPRAELSAEPRPIEITGDLAR